MLRLVLVQSNNSWTNTIENTINNGEIEWI